MNVHKQIFLIQVGSSKVEQQCTKGEIDPGFVFFVQLWDKFTVCFVFFLWFVYPTAFRRLRIQNFLAEALRVVEEVGMILLPMVGILIAEQPIDRNTMLELVGDLWCGFVEGDWFVLILKHFFLIFKILFLLLCLFVFLVFVFFGLFVEIVGDILLWWWWGWGINFSWILLDWS